MNIKSITNFINGNYYDEGYLIEMYEDYDTEVIDKIVEEDIEYMVKFLEFHGVDVIK